MKQILLVALLVFAAHFAFGQSFNDRLALKPAPSEKVNLQVFPNPATTHISLNDNEVVTEISVYNLVGKKIRAFFYTKGEQYFVGDLPRGMYLVQLTDRGSRVVTTQRVRVG